MTMTSLLTRTGFILAGLGVLTTTLAAAPAASAATVPFQDQNAVASIGLCDAHGNPITSGSIDSHAFVTAAASSAPVPSNYSADKGAKATLYAFQPRKGVDPGQWSGFQLTGGSVFADPQHPLVSGTNLDPSLREFTSSYAPRWDGLVELRIYYTAPNAVVSRRSYPAAVLRVSGSTWTMVQGATNLHCDLSKVTSSERLLLPSSAFDPAHPAVTHAPAPAGASAAVLGTTTPSANPKASSTGSAGSRASTAAPKTTEVADTDTRKGYTSSGGFWLIGLLVALSGAGLLVLRRVRNART